MPRPVTKAEQHDVDWDWYAVDAAGYVGHFTTAGLIPLPSSVAADFDAANFLKAFFESMLPSTSFIVPRELENKCGQWTDYAHRERYLKSFGNAARRGLYSHDLTVSAMEYIRVASPDTPLHVDQLSPEVHHLLGRTRASFEFEYENDFPAQITLNW